MQHKSENYRVNSPKDVSRLFEQDKMEAFFTLDSESEEKIENYVELLIAYQESDLIKIQILLYAATLDIFNEQRNLWIIKKAFEIAPFDGKETLMKLTLVHNLNRVYNQPKDAVITWERYIPANGSLVQNFLLHLRNYIPHSPHLWFALQISLLGIDKEQWITMFDISIDEAREKILKHFVHEWLHFKDELKFSCFEYAMGNYEEAASLCSKFLSSAQNEETPESEMNFAFKLINKCVDLVEPVPDVGNKKISSAINEYKKRNYRKVIEIIDNLITDKEQKKNYTDVEWGTLYAITAH